MSGKIVLLAVAIMAETHGPALAGDDLEPARRQLDKMIELIDQQQLNSSVAGWWYAARNQWQLDVVEMRSDGTATLGECVRTHPYNQACAGSAKVKMTATYALRGNKMWFVYEDGLQTVRTFAVSRPDPRSPMRKIQLNDGPNYVAYFFEMPSPPGGWK